MFSLQLNSHTCAAFKSQPKRRTDFYFICVITIAYSYGQSSQLKCLLDYAFSYSFCLFTFNLLTEYEDFYQVSYFQKGISVHTGTYTLLKRERKAASTETEWKQLENLLLYHPKPNICVTTQATYSIALHITCILKTCQTSCINICYIVKLSTLQFHSLIWFPAAPLMNISSAAPYFTGFLICWRAQIEYIQEVIKKISTQRKLIFTYL